MRAHANLRFPPSLSLLRLRLLRLRLLLRLLPLLLLLLQPLLLPPNLCETFCSEWRARVLTWRRGRRCGGGAALRSSSSSAITPTGRGRRRRQLVAAQGEEVPQEAHDADGIGTAAAGSPLHCAGSTQDMSTDRPGISQCARESGAHWQQDGESRIGLQ